MPASQTGFGNFFLERNLSMATGYQIPVLVQQQQQQQQQAQHLAAMAAGVPITYSGLQGYNFIPYPHHRHIGHMNNSFDLKAASPYHHALLARGGAFYPPYRPGGAAVAEDLSGRAAVTKVATRESTGALKAWLNEHLKNPYPTKGEKIMLAIITKMSLTQVSTWFANARRRLKKENRVSWASKGKSDEEEEEEDEEEAEGESDDEDVRLHERSETEPESERVGGGEDEQCVHLETTSSSSAPDVNARLEMQQQQHHEDALVRKVEKSDSESKDSKDNISSQKPKIWSLAETATSEPVKKKQHPAADSVFHPAGGQLWADWASRGGLFLPACYTTREII